MLLSCRILPLVLLILQTCNHQTIWNSGIIFYTKYLRKNLHIVSVFYLRYHVFLYLLVNIHLPHPGIKPRSPELQADSLLSEPPGKPFHLYSSFRTMNRKIFSLILMFHIHLFLLLWLRTSELFCIILTTDYNLS